MIVKLGNWSGNPLVAGLCDKLSALEGVSRRNTPQRCFFKHKGATLATVGVEQGKPVVEFLPREQDYAAAHGSPFVRPHPQTTMSRQGWLQARPKEQPEADAVVTGICARAGAAE